ncbi:MAG: metallophosphoesterase family protein [Nannocystaceae bacterium]
MRIAAISDLHIGARRWMDEFHHAEARFLRFLDHLEAEADVIVLVGDVYQTDHALVPGSRGAVRQLMAARRRLPEIAARLERPCYRYVHGNHDWIARDALGAVERLTLSADGVRVHFIHGHQFDPLFRGVYALTRAATWCTGRLRFVGLRPVADWFEGNDIRIKHARFHHDEGPYVRAGRQLLRDEAADVVVMGHTHVPVRARVPEGVLLNTGSCSRGQEMYALIDTARGTAELRTPAPLDFESLAAGGESSAAKL